MAKTKAEGKEKWLFGATRPADPEAPTMTELGAFVDGSCAIASSDSRISAAASATFSDPAVCDEIAVQVLGQSNYEGTVAAFRFWTEDGASDAGSDLEVADNVYQMLKEKGTVLYIAIRETNKSSRDPVESGDEGDLYEVETDNPQRPSSREGYQKRIIPLSIRNHWRFTVAPGA